MCRMKTRSLADIIVDLQEYNAVPFGRLTDLENIAVIRFGRNSFMDARKDNSDYQLTVDRSSQRRNPSNTEGYEDL
jgi:hypothetical protein